MRKEVEGEGTSLQPLPIAIGKDTWDVYVFGVTRVQHDWFVQMAIVGPRACMATARVDASGGRAAAAREIIRLVREWLLDDDLSDHAFLEREVTMARAC
jgi:hypothetical protein